MTLTELMSHQETKDNMIDEGVLHAAAELSFHEEKALKRQACLVLGGLLQSLKARKVVEQTSALKGLQKALVDEDYPVRCSAAWATCAMSRFRDGCDILNEELSRHVCSAFLSLETADMHSNC